MTCRPTPLKTVTKRDLAKYVAAQHKTTLAQATKWTDAVFRALRETFLKANPELRVEVRDFGVFEVKLTKAKRHARNPKTGEPIYVPSHRKLHFKASKLLKQFLRQSMDAQPTGEEKR
jgi:integration host factor subunit beta